MYRLIHADADLELLMDNNSKVLGLRLLWAVYVIRVADGAVGGHGNSGIRLPSLITANGVLICRVGEFYAYYDFRADICGRILEGCDLF